MTIVARITQDGEFKVAGNVDTTLPLVTDGLVAHYPFDGTYRRSTETIPSDVKVLYSYTSTGGPWKTYIEANYPNAVYNTDLASVSVATAQTYDLVIHDGYAWATPTSVITKMKEFVDNGVSCMAVGNDTRTSLFVSSYTATAHVAHTIVKSPTSLVTADVMSAGSADLYGGINTLTNGAVPAYYRSDTNQITGYTYTGDTGAILYFDQEGIAGVDAMTLGMWATCYNATVNYVDNGSTITRDGLAIDTGTTNRFSTPNFNTTSSGGGWNHWGSTGHQGTYGQSTAYQYIYDHTKQKYAHRVSNGSTATNDYLVYQSPATEATYRAMTCILCSEDFGPIDESVCYPTWNGRDSGAANHIWTSVEHLGGGFYKCKVDGVHQDGTNDLIGIYVRAGKSIYISEMQLENSPYGTEFVEGTRAASGGFYIPNPVKTGNYSMNFDVKINTTTGYVIGYQTILSVGNYYSNNSFTIMDLNGSNVSGVQRLIRKGNAAEWAWIGSNLTETTNYREYNTITVTRDATKYRVYSNGVYKGSIDHLSTTMQDKIWLGSRESGGSMGSSTIKNFSIYDRTLSDEEVKKVAQGTHGVTAGGLKTERIISEPNRPDDTIFFDLGTTGTSNGQFVTPTQDTANYTSGDAYVGGNSLEYNLHDSIGMDWSGDWSICYMKKPIGTSSGATTLTNYNIESLGANSNTVGGGYIWWGKLTGSDSISGAGNAAFTPADYFNNWHYVTLVKSGTTLTINTWLVDRIVRSRTVSVNTAAANYYVTHHGYDFKLGGWDNNSGCYTHFKNLIVTQRALTADELDSYRVAKLRAKGTGISIQSGVYTNETIT